jgi:AcrR family transcriptional regulator
MGTQQIRVPRQQRSIEKRNKIIEAGYQLFCEKGYHNTNTAEIARVAGVSTGIVYSYFKDKKDIFLCAIEVYTDSITAPIYEMIAKVEKPIDLYTVIKACIHQSDRDPHDE